MAAVEVPQTFEYKGGQLNAAPVLEVENFTNCKKRFMCLIIDDQMNSIINCLTAKSTWDDMILYHEGPSDVKESRVMDLKLCYNTFKFKDFQDSPDDEEDTRSSQDVSALNAFSAKNKGLLAETYDWDEDEVSSDDNEVTKVKALMALTDEERVLVIKESARNKEWVKISMKKGTNSHSNRKILGIDQLTEDTSSSGPKDPVFVKSSADNSEVSITDKNKPKLSRAEDSTLSNHDTGKHPLPPLEKLTGVEPVFEPKTIKSILRSKPHLNEPSLAPARGNKSSLASKTNSALASKLKNVNMEDDPPLAIVMKELNELKLQISKNKSSYFRTKNSQQCKRTNHRTCDHTEFMSSININQYHTGQGESSSRSRPARPTIPFTSCIHYGYNDHKYNHCVYFTIYEIYGSYDHDTHGHNRITSLRRGIKPRNPQHVTKNYETCGSNVHTTSDHNDIEWFRKIEAL
ncbi:hypothetical protein Tco_0429630 [Tanacetum coccineum]